MTTTHATCQACKASVPCGGPAGAQLLADYHNLNLHGGLTVAQAEEENNADQV